MRRSAILGLAAAAILCVAGAAAAEGLRWQLGYRNDVPAWVRIPGVGDKTTISWYMTWEVENRTGAARKPSVRTLLLTDTGKTFPDSGDPLTVEAVKKALQVKEIAIAADLRKGIDDAAKVKGVATFGDVDKFAKKVELRVYGLLDPVTMVKGKQVYEVKFW